MKEIRLETSSLDELLAVMLKFAKDLDDSGEYKPMEGWVYFDTIRTVAKWIKNLSVPAGSVYGFICVGHGFKLSLKIAEREFKIVHAGLDTRKCFEGDYPTQLEVVVYRDILRPVRRALSEIEIFLRV
ncbi:MAG: hypothetical protein WC217_01840 [Candidatus Paceibacterota bacterium]|jgi:hypothetical protein